MSQNELANRVRRTGISYHQQTINRIESGERPIRLDEAYTLAEIVGLPVEQMVLPPSASRERVQRALANTAEAESAFLAALSHWRNQQAQLRLAVDDMPEGLPVGLGPVDRLLDITVDQLEIMLQNSDRRFDGGDREE